ncbi:EVE domain-containing protein [Aureimonas ureilytica]|uniref:EVE domain-containing protein n=1 Tax=Aureimonas ureilytica TaxID=401562 RepID=UPI00037AE9FD|nr:EVE domain-containing protein [Aureimonas ureilytica]
MAFWLFKSEPFKWSFDQQKACGPAGTEWTGVRNYQARNFMRTMQIGERGFFYHSNEGKAVVGVVEVSALAHPDSTADDPRWECVDIRAVCDMPSPVTLDQVKAEPRLQGMVLGTNSRLSVQPVTEAEFLIICEMGGLDAQKALG